jgi:hypothetical protein
MSTATGLPSFVAGWNLHCRIASMALSSKPRPRVRTIHIDRGFRSVPTTTPNNTTPNNTSPSNLVSLAASEYSGLGA